MAASQFVFRADPTNRREQAHPDAPQTPEPYIADAELVQAVNLAIHLKRPLLLEGEAGCGKTRLASAVAYELGLPFYRWNIRSTTKAQDGLYTYNALLRLHDVQTKNVESTLTRDPADPWDYVELGAIGKSFCSKEVPAVVLIDEIDKADLDFPNDLLTVLDLPWKFEIPEVKGAGKSHEVKAVHPPIVIITSNKEKGNLPAPFLRRCVYYFLKFPDKGQLQEIVQVHYQEQSRSDRPNDKLIDVAATRFLEVRQTGGLYKNPGTSEFLDWVEALQNFNTKPYSTRKLAADKRLPYRELLLKLRADWQKNDTVS